MNEVTKILNALRNSGDDVSREVLDGVYHELRKLAAVRMAGEAAGHTLQPTALVHEAWLRLGGDQQCTWQSRAHFFGAAAEAMRRILVERARRKLRLKRGGHQKRTDFDESAFHGPVQDQKILEVHEAVEVLASKNRQMAEIVKMRFFAGLQNDEIAALLQVNEKTVRRNWELAKVRLLQLMGTAS